MFENGVLREYWYLSETNQKYPGEDCVAVFNTKLIELANQGGCVDGKSSTRRNMRGAYTVLF